MKKTLGTLFLIVSCVSFGQEKFTAVVKNETTGLAMPSVHILNLTQVIGTITDQKGSFKIEAKANDTLYFSYLGYKPLKIAVTNDMMKFGNAEFNMTELAFALEEIVVRPYKLTGYLDIDVRNAPINTARRYSISGLPNRGYEAGNQNPAALSKVLGSIFNPADFLNNIFGKNPNQMRKLKKMREDDEIKNLLASKFDRQVLMQLLGISRLDIDEILRNCSYSDTFMKEANDLQILEAISKCYEEYRILNL
ncbi:carboxypeptidase-like regulatory domain-containing protein [Flavobacteriaceae bacterium]|nr:carboxypeptidase-like regulatory domain-containing protein [Flavobacteriaceae bacterium]MDA9572100.1 carboxypeptidase-like regulatory domain-containing protein [Flavobacteriaceae bacterium]MDB3862623.1 carboxypeptidase-like regulatory domain-containing protein [Flavobacteriaceae bacterium]